jgi:hypothetical protein
LHLKVCLVINELFSCDNNLSTALHDYFASLDGSSSVSKNPASASSPAQTSNDRVVSLASISDPLDSTISPTPTVSVDEQPGLELFESTVPGGIVIPETPDASI